MSQSGAILCPICYNPIANEGEHRICALKPCGHLFCHSCICQSIKVKKECPLCRRKVTQKDILPLVWDSTLPVSQESLSKLYSDSEDFILLREQLAKKEFECKRLKEAINSILVNNSLRKNPSIIFEKEMHDSFRMCLADSCIVTTSHENKSYGVNFTKLTDFTSSRFTSLHKFDIKDVQPCDGFTHVASVSLDKSLYITNVKSQSISSQYNFDEPLFSCKPIRDSIIAIGGNHGKLYIYDSRENNHNIFQTDPGPPITSISSLGVYKLLVMTPQKTKDFDIRNTEFEETSLPGGHFICNSETDHKFVMLSRTPPNTSKSSFFRYDDNGNLTLVGEKISPYFQKMGRPYLVSYNQNSFYALPNEKTNNFELYCFNNLNKDLWGKYKSFFLHSEHPSPILDLIMTKTENDMNIFTLSSKLLRVFSVPWINTQFVDLY